MFNYLLLAISSSRARRATKSKIGSGTILNFRIVGAFLLIVELRLLSFSELKGSEVIGSEVIVVKIWSFIDFVSLTREAGSISLEA
jgi:hypothetical protein